MPRKKPPCDKDCFNCKYDTCINDTFSYYKPYSELSEEQKEYKRAYQRKLRDKARETGMCMTCYKRPATQGTRCYECYVKMRRYAEAVVAERHALDIIGKRRDAGLCCQCGSPPTPGQKLCEKHYQIAIQNATKARRAQALQKAKAIECAVI